MTEQEKASIGERIRDLREARGLSMSALARRVSEFGGQAKLSKGYLWELERGKRKNPSIEKLELIAKALDVDVMTILRTESERSGDPAEKSRPLSLVRFIEDRRQLGIPLDEIEIKNLEAIHYKGGQPDRAEQWEILLTLLREFCEPEES